MLFNSLDYAFFLVSVFVIYWFILKNSIKAQNLFLLIVSYIFYGWWDWRFLTLIFCSSFIDFLAGYKIDKTTDFFTRKLWLGLSICTNLGLLGFFKYYNFFIDSLIEAFRSISVTLPVHTLQIILPVGISFYTFQTLSYTIDVYRSRCKASQDPIAFFAFVSFFPQLVAGPIERALHLLPQFHTSRSFSLKDGKEGLRLILWGLFKKIVIADNCAYYADAIFSNYEQFSGSTLLLGSIYFAFQIYGDFSGYSDMAIGSARLLGFDLIQNFNYPYFSESIPQFWRRWHISLSNWFRDYLYIPLGGSHGSRLHQIRNILIVFTVSGLWHGANWTFIVWGLLNGLYYIPSIISGKRKMLSSGHSTQTHSLKKAGKITATFLLTCLTWVFFRSVTLADAFAYLAQLFTTLFTRPAMVDAFIVVIVLFVLIEWLQKEKEHPLKIGNLPVVARWLSYQAIIIAILFFNRAELHSFIYFQF